MTAKAGRPVPEHVPVFEEFSDEERARRAASWKAEQSYTSFPAPADPSFRGWLEGKPNPVLPEDAATYAKDSMASQSGTKLAGIFPGAPVGTTYPVPDPELEPPPRRLSHTDRVAMYPSLDEGNFERIRVDCWLTVSATDLRTSVCRWLTWSSLTLLLTRVVKFTK